jgi:hypothetical protein
MALLVFSGLFGLATQFFQGLESMALFAGVAALGGLVATSSVFDEREQQLLNQSFATAFQWTGIVLFVFFALYENLKWLRIGDDLIQFTNLHWIGLVFSLMLLLLGAAGTRVFKEQ